MKLKYAARCFGSVGILLPLLLIFLIAANATYACPEKRTVSYRTRVITNRSNMPTTVITYGGPAAYRGCSDSSSVTRRVKYVAVRDNSYYTTPRYSVVRNSDDYYPTRRVRYVSVRNADYDAPRYVVVKRQPAYVQRQARVFVVKNADIDDASRYIPVERYSTGTRYVAVRSGYRTGNGIVAYMDVDDNSPRRVVVSRTPVYTQTRYVADRDDDDDYVRPARYVAVRNVRNSCACADELSSSLDQIETRAPGHVVIKSDYIDGTEDVVYRGEVVNDAYAISSNIDDDEYVTAPSVSTNYVAYTDTMMPVRSRVKYIAASDIDNPCMNDVAVQNCYEDTSEMPARFIPASYDDSDLDDEAIVDTDNVTYVADNDIDDACLSRVAVQAPMEYRVRTVSYVPVADNNDYDSSSGVSMLYGWNDGSDSAIASVPVVNNDYVDAGTTYVVADDMGDSCSCPIAATSFDDDVDVDTVSYMPASYVEDIDTDDTDLVPVSDTSMVNYVPADNDEDIDTTAVNYIPDNAMDTDNVSYVPADSIDHVDIADMSADDTSMAVADVGTAVLSDTVATTALVDEGDSELVADMSSMQQVAGENGYNDGLAEGRAAAMNLRQNLPGESLSFQTATNGYDGSTGDAQLYQDAYRSTYLQGFSEGYNSVLGGS